ncbi:taste receptor type 2 member 104-like [Rhinoderma darwinii]|uniref:taste receptor type 2 member 104-like n=1 Tax=Rhinoderma darwinii TaxID=43563 RepID=UPI003F66FCA9
MGPFDLNLSILEFLNLLFLIPTNMFILIVNIVNWKKDKNLQQVDQLITSISVCNLAEGMMTSIRFLNLIYNSILLEDIDFALYVMVCSCNFWFSAFLCVYFCLKIVNVNNTLYIYMQRNFHKILPWLFISAIMGSVLVSVPLVPKFSEETSSNSRLNSSAINMQESQTIVTRTNDILTFMILSSTATLLFSISAFAIIISLFKHVNQVQQNVGGFRGPNMKAHVQASKTVISLLTTRIIFFFMLIVSITSIDNKGSYVIYPLLSVSKMVNCWILIKGNRNLDKALSYVLGGLHCTNKSNDMQESM